MFNITDYALMALLWILIIVIGVLGKTIKVLSDE
jgi:hypothetical protein